MNSIHNPNYALLIQTLKEAREKLKLTQTDLGTRLGREQTFVSKYESKERRLDIVELSEICNQLGLQLNEVVRCFMPSEAVLSPGAVELPHLTTSRGETPTLFDAISNNLDVEMAVAKDDGEGTKFISSAPLDSQWNHTDWKNLIDWFVSVGILSYKEIGALMLGHLNPPQVGTSLASKKTFQSHYPPRQTMKAVRTWFYKQEGVCQDCKTRLELQADHIVSREEKGDDADYLENMTLRCRRCNVIRRPSHKKGGQTFLTAEAALMWILFIKRPRTYASYKKMCREYGLTMADIRFQEAWAMALWLQREGLYMIDL